MAAPEARGSMRVRALQAAGLMLCCSLLGSACSKKQNDLPQAPLPAPGIPRQRPTPTAILPPVGSSPEGAAANNNSSPTSSSARFDMPPERKPGETAQLPPTEDKAPNARDYSTELATLLKPSAPGCLAGWDPEGKTSVTLQVTAQVMGSGSITRAEVQGAGLTPPMLACMQKQANALQLLAPIEDAPRSVSAFFTLQTQGSSTPQLKAAAEDTRDERDENPRDSKLQEVNNDPKEVVDKNEPVREPPEAPPPRELAPSDDNSPDQQP